MAKRKLVWTLYPSYLVVTLAAVLAVGWYATSAIESFHTGRVAADLEARARLVRRDASELLHRGEHERLDALCKTLGREVSTRITIVAVGGVVVADSEEDPTGMESHADRHEIRLALADGLGRSTRYSATLGKNMMYVAIPIRSEGKPEGKPVAVIRTSLPLTEVMAATKRLYVKILVAGLVVAGLAAVISLMISRRIARPLAEMKEVAQAFAEGYLDRRIPPQPTAEMSALAGAMSSMAAQLDERIRKVTEQRNELEALLTSMTEAVLAVDRRECVLLMNEAAGRLFDAEPGEVQGKPLQGVVRNSELQDIIHETLNRDETAEREVVLQKDTGEIFLQVHGTSLRSALGDGIGAVVVLTDVTGMKQLENIRREFVANVSHELRTPVTSIKGFLETIREGNLKKPEDAERFLEIASRQVDRLNTIIEDLLSLSRIEQHEREDISHEEHSVRDILEGAVAVCENQSIAKTISLELECPEELTATVNGALLEQAVINLIDNAVKYSEPNGTVTVRAAAEGDSVSITVRDEGCGIGPEHLPRLFERFYRVDKARSRKLGGTGLGLAIVKHIIQAHGGTVAVESALGEGSIFTLRLPRA